MSLSTGDDVFGCGEASVVVAQGLVLLPVHAGKPLQMGWLFSWALQDEKGGGTSTSKGVAI